MIGNTLSGNIVTTLSTSPSVNGLYEQWQIPSTAQINVTGNLYYDSSGATLSTKPATAPKSGNPKSTNPAANDYSLQSVIRTLDALHPNGL